MTRTCVLSAGCFLLFAVGAGTVIAAEPLAADFYVSPEGNDQWSGTLSQPGPNGQDGAFATLDRARDAVRQLRAQQIPGQPVTVMLREGVYRRTKPLVPAIPDERKRHLPRGENRS